jgi:putative ABC transport system permease protein
LIIMFSLFRTLSLGYLWRHKIRAVLVMLSIALGVAAWIATRALYGTVTHALHDAAAPLRGDADLYVTNYASRFIDASLEYQLQKGVPGIERIEPLILENVTARITAEARGAEEKTQSRTEAILIGLPVYGEQDRKERLNKRDIDILEQEDEFTIGRLYVQSQLAALAQPAFLQPFVSFLAPLPVMVGEQLDRDLLKGRKTFVIEAGHRALPVIVVGKIRARGAIASLGGHSILSVWQPVARLLGKPGMVHRLDIKLSRGADVDSALNKARAVVGNQGKVQTGEEQDRRLQHVLKPFKTGYRLGGIGALVVGLFLVYNAMSVNVTERRHDIGILRSVGATRTQVRALFLAEALVLGVIGALLGIPLGLAIAHLALGPIQRVIGGIFLMPIQHSPLEVAPGVLLTAGLAGVLTALAAALVPASRAAAEEPADAVRRAPPAAGVAYRLMQVGGSLTLGLLGIFLIAVKAYLSSELVVQTCLVLTVAGLGLAVVGYRLLPRGSQGEAELNGWRPLVSMVYGGLFILIGLLGLLMRGSLAAEKGSYAAVVLIFLAALLLTPLLAAVLTRFLQRTTRGFLPVESRLAIDNLVRSPGRTGVVIAALSAGVALTVPIAGMINSNRVACEEWIDATLNSDLYLRSKDLAPGGQVRALSPNMAEELIQSKVLPKGSRLVGLGYRYPEWDSGNRRSAATAGDEDSTLIFMTLIDAREHYLANKVLPGAEDDPSLDLWRRLGEEPGTVIVSDNFALMHGVKVGESVQMEGRKGPVSLRILGTIVDYNWIRGSIWVDRLANRDTFSGDEVNAWEVYLPQEYREDAAEIRDKLVKSPLGARYRLMGMTRQEVRESVLHAVESLYALAYTQVVLTGIVVVLGVVAALLISILSRQRELGLLRAVGATRVQVLHTVLAEAVLIGLVGTVLGIVVGLPLEWYWVRVILFEEAGFLFPVRIPWIETCVIALMAVLFATLAGLAPACKAIHFRIADSIAYE